MLRAVVREARYLTGLVRTLLRVAPIRPVSRTLVADDLEAAVARWPRRLAIRFEGRELTYAAMDAMADGVAAWAAAAGLKRGDTIAVMLPNRLEYVPLWFGLTKIGVVAALINYQLAGGALRHCLELAGAHLCIADKSTTAALAALDPPPARVVDLDDELLPSLQGFEAGRPPRSARAGLTDSDTALLIYTSGTTGLPKAARITHMRARLYMRGFAGSTGARPSDRIYVTLPLYHATGGLCAVGAALLNGASILLRDGFSASRFWAEAAHERATMFVYIGEVCRYLANQPVAQEERAHRIRLAFGNGLSADVWREMETRFRVPRVLEFYGSTEGNVSMFNFDGGLGAIGRLPPYLSPLFNVRLAKFDFTTDAPVRGADGFCIPCAVGEIGECLGEIHGGARTDYTGYVDRAASDRKVLRNAFRRGDAWFLTGDLMRRDGLGYFYFVDRVGDTFRWKGENVSTTEVANVVSAAPGVAEAIVYGVAVPHREGRAGMAAIVTGEGFDFAELARVIDTGLPAYARPLFVRLSGGLAHTGTFKPRKQELIADGFDPVRCQGRVYLREDAGGYMPLTADIAAQIGRGELRL